MDAADVKGKIAEGLFWVGLAIAGLAYSASFDHPLSNYELGTVSWPRALLAIVLVFGLIQLGFAVAVRASTSLDTTWGRPEPRTIVRMLWILVTPLVLVWLLPRIGFVPFALMFVFLLVLGFGYRHITRAAAVSVVATGTIMFIFTNLLFLPLPLGTWPGFYELNSTITLMLGG